MKRKNKRQSKTAPLVALLVVAFLLFGLLPRFQVRAQQAGKSEVTIHRYAHVPDTAGAIGVGKQAGVSFWIWTLPQTYKDFGAVETAINGPDYRKLLVALDGLSEDELDQLCSGRTTTEPTNAEGDVTISLTKGAYYVREIPQTPPLRYTASPFLFTMPLQSSENRENTLHPKIHLHQDDGRVVLKKKDAVTGKFLPGAGFELRREESLDQKNLGTGSFVPLKEGKEGYVYDESRLTSDLTMNLSGKKLLYTDAKGEIRIDALPAGRYVFVEKEVPKGYTATKTVYPFSVEAGTTTTVIAENQPGGGYHFFKYDAKSKKGLEGARFRVLRYDAIKKQWLNPDASVAGGKTDLHAVYVTSGADGSFAVQQLPFDKDGTTYYLYEISAPAGYILPKESCIPFQVTATSFMDSAGNEIDISNEPQKPPVIPPTNPPEKPPENPPVPTNPPSTGDRSILPHVMMGLAAGALLLLMAVLKKMKERSKKS